MDRPETRYAETADGAHIAYQVVGEGPIDLVYVAGAMSNVELSWEEPRYARFLQRLSSFSRLIHMDRRGVGGSDRLSDHELPSLEILAEDLGAVLDATNTDSAAILAFWDGGFTSILFAATHPQRVSHLILWDCSPTWMLTPDTPWGWSPGDMDEWLNSVEKEWGTRELARKWTELFVPSRVGDERFEAWLARWNRQAASPAAGTAIYRLSSQFDVRHVLPSVQAPTLVLHGMDKLEPIEAGRFLAAGIPSAKIVELPGRDVAPWGSDADLLVGEIEHFLTGTRRGPEPSRVLRTVLFTDIVGSTRMLADIGDTRWTDLRDAHNRVTRAELERYRGQEIDNAGDGFLATFDGPARAIHCSRAIVAAVRDLGLEIRAGLHTGECEVTDGRVGGIAVHIGARVAALAGPSEVLVSQTVKDLVAGSGLTFEDAGEHQLKGVPDSWHLYRVVG